MPDCETCGGHVTERFQAVFGDNEGAVYACYECATHTGLFTGEGTTATETETDHGERSVSTSMSDWRTESGSG
jgi:hypothetical protein